MVSRQRRQDLLLNADDRSGESLFPPTDEENPMTILNHDENDGGRNLLDEYFHAHYGLSDHNHGGGDHSDGGDHYSDPGGDSDQGDGLYFIIDSLRFF
jgi:hypothetical protein